MTSGDNKYPLRDVFQKFGPDYIDSHPGLSTEKQKIIHCIASCKTGLLGYNVSKCEKCGRIEIHSSSCNNRYCSNCQAHLAKKWELERNTELITGIAYYHIVITMPHELNPLILKNEKMLLDLLFTCAHNTLLTLCEDPKHMGGKPGIVSVLHMGGQTLSFHPHLHICISGGGLTPAGKFVTTRHKGFFLPLGPIAKMFRGKYLSVLKTYYTDGKLDLSLVPDLEDADHWQSFIDKLYQKKWLPFVKETFNGKGNAIRYLARYSYRTAIANSRIISVDENTVSFRYKDYADHSREKIMTLTGEEFISRFLYYVLPSNFHRIRFAGYLTNSKKTKNLKLIHKLRGHQYRKNVYRDLTTRQLLIYLYGYDIEVCRECQGHMKPLPGRIPEHKVFTLRVQEDRRRSIN